MMDYQIIKKQYEEIRNRGISINMERGWPSNEQLELSLPMLDMVQSNTELIREVDYRGYAGTGGILPLKKLFADVLDVEAENIYIGGTMSTSIMYDVINKYYCFGKNGSTPWCKLEKVKFICPSPGYEKHFKICKTFGIEMIAVPMLADGPDMDMAERLIADDDAIKGIWCVPLYSNPTGIVYSDKVVERIASMKSAAKDFVIMWDNAYCVHHLTEKYYCIKNIINESKNVGNPDRVFEFTSTSKITFPGGGVGICASSIDNIKWLEKNSLLQLKSGDKINQLRHYLFLKDKANLLEHMKKHASIIKPKFDLMDEIFRSEIGEIKNIKWNNPEGGYFMHVELLPNMAKLVCKYCKDAGVSITPAGSTYPYGVEKEDKTLRLAPTFLDIDSLTIAMKVISVSIKLAYTEVYGSEETQDE